jgi:hypothetical protein
MQNVSTAWKQTLGCFDYADRPKFVPVSFVEVQYTVADPDAQIDAAAADNGHMDYSNTAQITNSLEKTFARFVTLEQNGWVLNGSWGLRPSTISGDTGFNSTVMSGANCVFASRPVITVSFDEVYTTLIPGLTITWSTAYDEMARHFIVRVYNGATLKNTFEVTDNTSVQSVVEEDITGYNKIEIEIVEWCLPHCRARIEEIIIGVVTVYDKTKLLGYNHKLESDILSLNLPDSSVVFEISNITGEWNPDNPEGKTKYLLERQEIVVRYGYKIGSAIEWIRAGTFFMSEWETPSNGISARFTARSLIDFMGAKYAIPANTTMTLYELAVDALTQANLPTNPDGSNKWSVSPSLSGITITLPVDRDNNVDFDYTLAEVLQMCANAACCTLNVDRSGNIIIAPLSATMTDYLIDQFVSYANAEYKLSKPLKSVDVNDGLGVAVNGDTGEVQKIKNPLIQNSTIADAVAVWVKGSLAGRKTLSGEYRPDPRLDALDKISTQNKYATNAVCVTSIEYKYAGAFRGKFEGRVTE